MDDQFTLFPDIEAIVISRLSTALNVPVGVRVPLEDVDSYIVIHQNSEREVEKHKWNRPEIHLDVYAKDRAASKLLAQQAKIALYQLRGTRYTVPGHSEITAWISFVGMIMGIQYLPDQLEVPIYVRHTFGMDFIVKT